MKSLCSLVFIILLFTYLSACASDEDVTNELIDYYNNKWISIHTTKVQDLAIGKRKLNNISELDENYDQEAIEIHKTELIPVSEKVVKQYESVQLKYREVKKLNKLQIKAEKHGVNLMNSIVDYYNRDIEESEYLQKEYELKSKYDDVTDYLEKLMDKYNLEYDMDKNNSDGVYKLKRKKD